MKNKYIEADDPDLLADRPYHLLEPPRPKEHSLIKFLQYVWRLGTDSFLKTSENCYVFRDQIHLAVALYTAR